MLLMFFSLFLCTGVLIAQEDEGTADSILMELEWEDCSQLREGTFKMLVDGDMKAKLRRRDSLQIEEYETHVSVYRLTWVSECKYELRLIESQSLIITRMGEELVIETNIYKIKGNRIYGISKLKGEEKEYWKSIALKEVPDPKKKT